VSDIDTEVVDGLKALDPERPIREADLSLMWNWRTPKPWRYCPQTLEPVVQT
jgi:hypothetical protein